MRSLITDLKSSESLLFLSYFLLFDHLLYFSEQFLNVINKIVVHFVQVFLC